MTPNKKKLILTHDGSGDRFTFNELGDSQRIIVPDFHVIVNGWNNPVVNKH